MNGQELERVSPSGPTEPAEVVIGLMRVAAGVWLRSAAWSLAASLRMARAARDPREATQLAGEIGDGLRAYAREFLGVADLDERIRQVMPSSPPGTDAGGNGAGSARALRERGAELLRQSADVNIDQAGHPAYVRILDDLAPDEARILRLFCVDGAQPSVDVRSTQLLGIGSALVAEGLNMIGPQAGCRHAERVPAYLNNLNRLGLIWFSKEPLEDPVAYQVLEAQPAVLDAIKGSARAKTVQRSIGLTPFGRDFVEACIPIDPVATGEVIDGP